MRTWTFPEPRDRLTRKQIAELFLRQDGKCPECLQKLHMKGNKPVCVDEHVNPLWRGGSNDLANRELWCVPCTKPKTAEEAGQRAKTLSVRDKHIGAVKRKSSFQTNRDGKYRKKMDGTVERR